MPKSSNRNRNNTRDLGGLAEIARDRPLATAAAAAAVVGTGVFLWSRRNQIGDQLSDLSNQLRDWTQNFPAPEDTGGLVESGETTGTGAAPGSRGKRGMSKAGGGNASLGAHTGGAGTTGSVSGRGRARSTTPQATG